jgi:Uncharacterized protein conserved in bacteria (DUF2188)
MAKSGKLAIHTVSHGDGWANRREGATRVSNTAKTKSEATKAGRAMAQREKTEHIVHGKNGEIQSRNSYGNDPRRSKG